MLDKTSKEVQKALKDLGFSSDEIKSDYRITEEKINDKKNFREKSYLKTLTIPESEKHKKIEETINNAQFLLSFFSKDLTNKDPGDGRGSGEGELGKTPSVDIKAGEKKSFGAKLWGDIKGIFSNSQYELKVFPLLFKNLKPIDNFFFYWMVLLTILIIIILVKLDWKINLL